MRKEPLAAVGQDRWLAPEPERLVASVRSQEQVQRLAQLDLASLVLREQPAHWVRLAQGLELRELDQELVQLDLASLVLAVS